MENIKGFYYSSDETIAGEPQFTLDLSAEYNEYLRALGSEATDDYETFAARWQWITADDINNDIDIRANVLYGLKFVHDATIEDYIKQTVKLVRPYNQQEPIYGADFEEDNEPLDYEEELSIDIGQSNKLLPIEERLILVEFASLIESSVGNWHGLEAPYSNGTVQVWRDGDKRYALYYNQNRFHTQSALLTEYVLHVTTLAQKMRKLNPDPSAWQHVEEPE